MHLNCAVAGRLGFKEDACLKYSGMCLVNTLRRVAGSSVVTLESAKMQMKCAFESNLGLCSRTSTCAMTAIDAHVK